MIERVGMIGMLDGPYPPVPASTEARAPIATELDHLIGRAVVDAAFRETLLTDPLSALREYAAPTAVREVVLAVRGATTFVDFAGQALAAWESRDAVVEDPLPEPIPFRPRASNVRALARVVR
jgi:hypothetical protein